MSLGSYAYANPQGNGGLSQEKEKSTVDNREEHLELLTKIFKRIEYSENMDILKNPEHGLETKLMDSGFVRTEEGHWIYIKKEEVDFESICAALQMCCDNVDPKKQLLAKIAYDLQSIKNLGDDYSEIEEELKNKGLSKNPEGKWIFKGEISLLQKIDGKMHAKAVETSKGYAIQSRLIMLSRLEEKPFFNEMREALCYGNTGIYWKEGDLVIGKCCPLEKILAIISETEARYDKICDPMQEKKFFFGRVSALNVPESALQEETPPASCGRAGAQKEREKAKKIRNKNNKKASENALKEATERQVLELNITYWALKEAAEENALTQEMCNLTIHEEAAKELDSTRGDMRNLNTTIHEEAEKSAALEKEMRNLTIHEEAAKEEAGKTVSSKKLTIQSNVVNLLMNNAVSNVQTVSTPVSLEELKNRDRTFSPDHLEKLEKYDTISFNIFRMFNQTSKMYLQYTANLEEHETFTVFVEGIGDPNSHTLLPVGIIQFIPQKTSFIMYQTIKYIDKKMQEKAFTALKTFYNQHPNIHPEIRHWVQFKTKIEPR